MTEQDNLRAVQRMYAAFQQNDLRGLLEGFAQDVDWWMAGPEQIPICGRRRGREGVADFFNSLGATVETLLFEPQEFVAQGNTVVVLGRERHRVRSTGRGYEGDWVQVFTLAGGKVLQYREYVDTFAMSKAFDCDGAPRD